MIVIGLRIWMIKIAIRVLFFIWKTSFTWSSKKQSMVTLSTCEPEYVATTLCVCHSIWLRRLLKELWMTQEKPTEIYMDNSSVIALTIHYFMIEVSILTQDFITYEIALQTRKLKLSMWRYKIKLQIYS